jgi:hypothetical protein
MSPDGQTFTPTHASKKGRRYLYYTLTKTGMAARTIEIEASGQKPVSREQRKTGE